MLNKYVLSYLETQKITRPNQLDCGGCVCPKCQKCCDWYKPGYFSSYRKRDGANCRLAVAHPHVCVCTDKKTK